MNFSKIAEPFRRLKRACKFEWSQEHQLAFDKTKNALITDCLGHFETDDPTEPWIDAGSF